MGQSRPYGFGENQTVINLSVDHDMGGGAGYQPGSTFKPVIAAAALEQGTSPEQEYPSPYRMQYPSPVQTCDGEWQGTDMTQNENKEEVGPYGMKEATAKSVNTYFVQLISDMGICPAVKMAQKMGIERADGKPLQQVPSMTLGVQETSPLTMAAGYAAFANDGEYCSPVAIESITDARGRAMKVPQTSCRSAMSKRTADTINTLLKGVVEDGTGKEAGLQGRDSAGKTGTSDSRYAAWFVGYTPNAAGAVWVGDPMHKRKMYDISIGGVPHDKVYGADTPGPIWRDAMSGALADRPAPQLPTVPIGDPAKDRPQDDGKGHGAHKPGRGHGGDNKPGGGWHIPGFPNLLGGGNGGW